MSKTIQEQIEIMKHYEKFNDEVEQLYVSTYSAVSEKWKLKSSFPFDWHNSDYRQKKSITIEKWLCVLDSGEYRVFETSDISMVGINRVKLLDKYKVEL